MKIKSICIVGVDGSGKSSVVESLREYYGDSKVVVQYMGSRLWESNIAKKYLAEGRKGGSFFVNCMTTYAFIYEMYYRVLKHKKEQRLVIFDRYVDEKIVAFKNKKGGLSHVILLFLYYLFLKWWYHKPNIAFYLKCPIDISLKRKDDIETEYEISKLKKIKKLMDNYYKCNNNIIVIDTSLHNLDETIKQIINVLDNRKLLP